MSKYKATDLADLQVKVAKRGTQTAFVQNDYQFEVDNTTKAKDRISDRLNTYQASNGNTGVWSETSTGKSRKFLSDSDVKSLFDKKSNLTIMHDTGDDNYKFVKDGEKFPFDVNILDPSGDTQARLKFNQGLKQQLEATDDADKFDVLADQYQRNTIQLNTKIGNLLRTFVKAQ